MHYTRIATFLLGAWILGGLFMGFVATQNFRTVDRILSSPPPEAAKIIKAMGNDSARLILRHLASEENRLFFENWEILQLVVGVALTGLLLFGIEKPLLAGFTAALVLLTAFEHFKITPEMLWLGRSIDFLPRTPEPLARTQFGRLHALYGVIEITKLLLALLVSGFLFALRRRRVRPQVEVEPVDNAHHRHVNR
jgi:hypothetical protein